MPLDVLGQSVPVSPPADVGRWMLFWHCIPTTSCCHGRRYQLASLDLCDVSIFCLNIVALDFPSGHHRRFTTGIRVLQKPTSPLLIIKSVFPELNCQRSSIVSLLWQWLWKQWSLSCVCGYLSIAPVSGRARERNLNSR